jgi:hypothetical protein
MMLALGKCYEKKLVSNFGEEGSNMIYNKRNNSFARLVSAFVTVVALVLLGTSSAATTFAQTTRENAHTTVSQQPLYTEYRGVHIGMTAPDVRAKLGEPLQKADDQDLYVFSDKETAQIAYDASHQVKVISVDYLGGVGAPDYKAVVGSDVAVNADGSMYKLVRYEGLGFWVSYNRTAGEVAMVTITIQKNL